MMFSITSKISGLFAAAVLAAAVATGAQAATVTLIDHSTNKVGNTANVFAAGYFAYTPVGATWDDDPTVTPPPGTVPFKYQSPFNNTPEQDTRSYFSSGGVSGTNGAAAPVTLTFASAQQSINMLWGSIDTFNTINFFKGAVNVFSLNGATLGAMLGLTQVTPTGFEQVALLNFSGFDGGSFDSIEFQSGAAAFEFALSPVPVPAAGLLLITALGGVAMLRRRKAV